MGTRLGIVLVVGLLLLVAGCDAGPRSRETFEEIRDLTAAASLLTMGAPVAVAAVLLAAFLLAERRRHDPLLPPRLLRRRRAMVSDVAALTVLAAPFGVSYLVTVYHQDVLGRSPWTTALVLLPGAVLSAVVGQFLAARLLDRFGLPVVYPGALLVVAAGNALLFAMTPATATWVTVAATVVSFGLGMGIAYPAATLGGIVEVDEVDEADHGTAAGLNNTAPQLGGGLGLAVVAALVTGSLGGGTIGEAGVGAASGAVHLGVIGVVALPLAGAVVTAVGLRRDARVMAGTEC